MHNSFELVCVESGGQRTEPQPQPLSIFPNSSLAQRSLDLEFFQQRLSQYLEAGNGCFEVDQRWLSRGMKPKGVTKCHETTLEVFPRYEFLGRLLSAWHWKHSLCSVDNC